MTFLGFNISRVSKPTEKISGNIQSRTNKALAAFNKLLDELKRIGADIQASITKSKGHIKELEVLIGDEKNAQKILSAQAAHINKVETNVNELLAMDSATKLKKIVEKTTVK